MVALAGRAMDVPKSFVLGGTLIAPGQLLAGKYRVERVLGAGGMGVVLAATHVHLHQRVALKLMLPEGLANPVLGERFAREARAAARLKSAHVAHVFDVGTLEMGSPYMVMEYLEGSDLASIVARHGALDVDVAVDCVLQACDAVAEAHSIGIVHRDLKPGNLFLTNRNDGRPLVKVLDFGISKHASNPTDLSLTSTTEVIGSPNYMSPEQLRSARRADARSDIWGLGVILHELLTGRVPFVAETFAELASKVLNDPPIPLSTTRPEATPELARIVGRCLEKDPERRYPNVAELAAALAPFARADTRELAERIARISQSGGRAPQSATPRPIANGTAVTVHASSVPGRKKTWAIAGGLIALAAAALGGALARRPLHRNEPSAEAAPASAVAAMSLPATPVSALGNAAAGGALPSNGIVAPVAMGTLAAGSLAIDAGASLAARPARSRPPVLAPVRATAGRPSADAPVTPETPPSATVDSPSHRTSW